MHGIGSHYGIKEQQQLYASFEVITAAVRA